MNDNPGSANEFVDLVTHNGWVAAVIATTWGVLLRWLIGRYQRREEEFKKWTDSVNKELVKIRERLTVIEGRSFRRRRGDYGPSDDDPTDLERSFDDDGS